MKFYVKGSQGKVFLTDSEIVFDFLQETATEESEEEEDEERPRPEREREKKKIYNRLVFRLKFEGANPEIEVVGEKELPGKINYFIGSQSNWRGNIPTFEEVWYRDLYPGIDLRFYFQGANLQSSYILKPGADPEQIILAYEGIDELEIKPEGDLLVLTTFGGFVTQAPDPYQEINGKKKEVEGGFKLLGDKKYTFDISSYDPQTTLIIE